ncbi:MAG TPA: hypothetical protein VE172_12325 [Stackebrandtia sp.]|jgi:hypothetical protein|uniref:hypothetical protein n=1 Tax=Stackebrandtia sp. TaxID=2023065 RepID=UPI002D671B22|nr:hypothetical protein [Stackebrandtia sp.]HZE39587.1 hypothetical protein [Stackebrandtia sp.]
MTGSPVLPLRPLTIGELLDAAAALLRSRWRSLLVMSFTLALVEQVIMTTLRELTIDEVKPKYVGQIFDNGYLVWLWIVVGMTTEIMIITLLSGPAARTAVAAVRGEDPSKLPFLTLNSRQWGYTVLYTVLLGVAGAIAAAMCVIPWFAVFAIFGLSVPALIADGLSPGRALWRSPKLLLRSSGRTAGVQLLAYFSWLLIRLVLTCAAGYIVLSGVIDFSTILFDYFLIVLGLCYLAINTAGYAMLACVEAVLHIETRVRSEGLDIAVTRMRARGDAVSLAAPEAR